MLRLIILVAFMLFASKTGLSQELRRIFRHGELVLDEDTYWEGRVEHASWVDDEFVVFFARGQVTCISTKTGEIQWTSEKIGRIFDWSLSRSTKRLAIRNEQMQLFVIDCVTGTVIFHPSDERLSELFGQNFVGGIALSPTDGRLVIESAGSTFGRFGFVVSADYSKVEATFDIDAYPRSISISPDGKRIAVIADDDVVSVREILQNREVFFRGTRIHEAPEIRSYSIGEPFFSHVRDSGDTALVYVQDGGCWSTGTVTVHNLATEKSTTFCGRNGHVELDVCFRTKRMALTGTSKELAVLDFEGNVIAAAKSATANRNTSVEFSPSEDRLLVGSWDNTVCVFKLVETDKATEDR